MFNEQTDVMSEMFGTLTPESASLTTEEVPTTEIPVETPAVAVEAPVAAETPVAETPVAETPTAVVVEATPEQEPAQVPVAVVKGLREDKRALREQLSAAQIAQARAEAKAELYAEMVKNGVQAPSAPQTPKEAEKSPLEKFAAEYPGEAVPVEVFIKQREWDQQQATVVETQTKTQTLAQQVEASVADAKVRLADEKVGEGLGLDAVVGLARQHGLVTEADENYAMQQGKHAADTLYQVAILKIKQSGGVPAQEFNRRVIAAQTNRQAPVVPTKINQPPVVPAKPVTGGKPPETPVVEEPDDSDRITKFMFSK